jgi:hypothetical protein
MIDFKKIGQDPNVLHLNRQEAQGVTPLFFGMYTCWRGIAHIFVMCLPNRNCLGISINKPPERRLISLSNMSIFARCVIYYAC